jgi:hypothetical protein
MAHRVKPGDVGLEKVVQVAYHQNANGEPFYVVLFTSDEAPDDPKMAVVFENIPGAAAVFNLDLLDEGIIEFGQNSFRGDQFESSLRRAISDGMSHFSQTPVGLIKNSTQIQ